MLDDVVFLSCSFPFERLKSIGCTGHIPMIWGVVLGWRWLEYHQAGPHKYSMHMALPGGDPLMQKDAEFERIDRWLR